MSLSSIDPTSTIQSQAMFNLAGSQLDRDAFMHLLVTELRYQDPTQPMEDKEFIAQLAQFSTLEQAEQTNTQLSLLAQLLSAGQAVSLVGRTIEYIGPEGDTLTGEVTAIAFDQGLPYLLVGEEEINPANVISVS